MKNLGFGSVKLQKDGIYNLSVRGLENNKILAPIFNGKLVFNKTKIRFKHYYEVFRQGKP